MHRLRCIAKRSRISLVLCVTAGVICQVGLPLCHERFAIGPSRDQEGLLGAAP